MSPGLRGVILAAAAACGLAGCVIHPGTVPETVSGQVVDADTGEPIGGARLHLEDFPANDAVSSGDGQFTLDTTRQWQTIVLGKDLNGARVLVVEATAYDTLRTDVKLDAAQNLLVQLHRGKNRPPAKP